MDFLISILVNVVVMLAMQDGDFDREDDAWLLNAVPGIVVYEDSTWEWER